MQDHRPYGEIDAVVFAAVGILVLHFGSSPRERALGELPSSVTADLKSTVEDGGQPDAAIPKAEYMGGNYKGRLIVGDLHNNRGQDQYHDTVGPVISCYCWRRQR